MFLNVDADKVRRMMPDGANKTSTLRRTATCCDERQNKQYKR